MINIPACVPCNKNYEQQQRTMRGMSIMHVKINERKKSSYGHILAMEIIVQFTDSYET